MATLSFGAFPPRFALALSPRVGLAARLESDALRLQSGRRAALVQWRPGLKLSPEDKQRDKAVGGGLRTFGPLFIATGPALETLWR